MLSHLKLHFNMQVRACRRCVPEAASRFFRAVAKRAHTHVRAVPKRPPARLSHRVVCPFAERRTERTRWCWVRTRPLSGAACCATCT